MIALVEYFQQGLTPATGVKPAAKWLALALGELLQPELAHLQQAASVQFLRVGPLIEPALSPGTGSRQDLARRPRGAQPSPMAVAKQFGE